DDAPDRDPLDLDVRACQQFVDNVIARTGDFGDTDPSRLDRLTRDIDFLGEQPQHVRVRATWIWRSGLALRGSTGGCGRRCSLVHVRAEPLSRNGFSRR